MTEVGFCHSCGATLAPDAVKCADCGAPVAGSPVRRTTSRPSAAALLLLILFALSLFQGFFVVTDPDLPTQQTGIDIGTFSVRGRVLDAAGEPARGVNVTTPGKDGAVLSAVSDANGSYALVSVPAGLTHVRAQASGDGPNATVRVFLVRDQNIEIRLPSPGAAETHVDHGSYATVAGLTRACGVLLLLAGGLVLLSAIACYRRRNWGLALSGAIASLIVSLPLSLLIGAIAVALVSRSRGDFR